MTKQGEFLNTTSTITPVIFSIGGGPGIIFYFFLYQLVYQIFQLKDVQAKSVVGMVKDFLQQGTIIPLTLF